GSPCSRLGAPQRISGLTRKSTFRRANTASTINPTGATPMTIGIRCHRTITFGESSFTKSNNMSGDASSRPGDAPPSHAGNAPSPQAGNTLPSQAGNTLPSQADKALSFQRLHERAGAFVIPNPWDAGSAKMLAAIGFEALA